MRRRLVTFLAILSLLLCLATVALWVRSYWWDDNLTYTTSGSAGHFHAFGAISTFGIVSFWEWRVYLPTGHLVHTWNLQVQPSHRGSLFPFGYGVFSSTAPVITTRRVWVPHWFLALLFAILPLLRLRSILRTRRQNRVGLCQHCGYDLRATPDRCPECGTAPDKLTISD